jgi:hypothetical protein
MPDVAPVLNQLKIVTKDFDATLSFYRAAQQRGPIQTGFTGHAIPH